MLFGHPLVRMGFLVSKGRLDVSFKIDRDVTHIYSVKGHGGKGVDVLFKQKGCR